MLITEFRYGVQLFPFFVSQILESFNFSFVVLLHKFRWMIKLVCTSREPHYQTTYVYAQLRKAAPYHKLELDNNCGIYHNKDI